MSEEDRNALLDTLDKQKDAFLKNRRFWPRRNFNANNRRWRRFGRRNQRYAFSAKRTGFGWKRPAFNNRNVTRDMLFLLKEQDLDGKDLPLIIEMLGDHLLNHLLEEGII